YGGANLDGIALLDEDFDEAAYVGRGHLGVHLVGRDLQERLVLLDLVADLLLPLEDAAFHDAFAHFGHDDIDAGHEMRGLGSEGAGPKYTGGGHGRARFAVVSRPVSTPRPGGRSSRGARPGDLVTEG